MEFRLLGPVEVRVAGRRYDLPPTEGCLLACLAAAPGRLISSEGLIERLWGANPPPGAHGTLQAHASRLRRKLREAAGGDEGPMPRAERGYVLQVDEETVDLHRFYDLRAKGRAMTDSGDHTEAARLFREAEALWRGEPLAGLPGDWAARRRTALEEEHKAVTLERIDAELRLGRPGDLVGDLYEFVRRYPLDERPVECLMRALYLARRVPEASEVYRHAQQRFADEGVDLSPNLEGLQERILRGDPELAEPSAPGPALSLATPNLLRRDIPEFVGRAQEMQQVLDAIAAPSRGTAVPVVTIHGMPGVGKTALAFHLAHQLADHYPDAQLDLELNAHHPIQDPLDPGTGLGILLRLIGAPPGGIPRDLDERAALWRALLANRRVLLVLDDAAGAEQVRPLLPGTAECLVLITSRARLTGLASVLPLPLDVLRPGDAAELLRRIVGPDRTADAEGVAEVVRLCGYWPLGIHVAGGQLRERRSWRVKDLVDRLVWGPHRPGRTRLDDSMVAETFESSYQDLSGREQRMLRRLGTFPGSDFSAYVAAALADTTPADSERFLDRLYECHLIEEPERRRFRLHDLLRDYARDVALRDDSEHDLRAAVQRMLYYYLHTADQADQVMYPHRRRIEVGSESPQVPAPPLRTRDDAQRWLDEERVNLLTVARYAADHGWPRYGALLAHVLTGYLETHGHWTEAVAAHERAVRLWRDLDDHFGQAQALLELATACARMGDYGRSLRHAELALTLRRDIGDRWGEGEALNRIGTAYWHRGRYAQALAHYRDALAIRRDVGDRPGEAETLNDVGIVHRYTGRYHRAAGYFQAALAIHRDVKEQRGVVNQLNNLGEVEGNLGRYDEALDHYRRALAIAENIGMRQGQAVLTNNIGNVLRDTGNTAGALENYREALAVYRAIGDRRCEADALVNIGSAYDREGHFREALIHHQRALVIGREISEPYVQAQATLGAAEAYLGLKRYAAALDSARAALVLARAIGNAHQEAQALAGIGSALLHMQGRSAAEPYWRQALALFEELGLPEAATVTSRLRSLDATGT